MDLLSSTHRLKIEPTRLLCISMGSGSKNTKFLAKTNPALGLLPAGPSQHQSAWESRTCILGQSVQIAPSRRSEKPPIALVKDSITRSAPCKAGCSMQGPHQVLSTTSRRCVKGDVVGLGLSQNQGLLPSWFVSLQNRHFKKQKVGKIFRPMGSLVLHKRARPGRLAGWPKGLEAASTHSSRVFGEMAAATASRSSRSRKVKVIP